MTNSAPFLNMGISDIYIEVTQGCDDRNPTPASYYKLKQKPGAEEDPTLRFSSEYDASLNMLRKEVIRGKGIDAKEDGDGNFSITYGGVRMRCCVSPTISSNRNSNEREEWACIRVFDGKEPDLDELKFKSDHAITVLKRLVKRTGLVLISGPTGGGKSTTGLASFRYCMASVGGTGMMLEDPCEFVMQGEFSGNPGKAVIFQREVRKPEDWVDGSRRALRFKPHCVFIGELRDPDAVAQVLRLAISGHLVYATIHAGTVEQAIQSLICIAKASIGDLASQLVADGLVAVINQKFVDGVVDMTVLEIPTDMATAIRSDIRSDDFKALRQEIETQSRKHANSAPAPQTQPRTSTVSTSAARQAKAPPRRPEPEKKRGWFK